MKKIGKINIVAVFIIIFCVSTIIKTRLPREVKEVRSNGIVASIEDVRQNGSKYSVEVSLRKEDGTTFLDEEKVGRFGVSAKSTISSWETDTSLSSDKKVLTYIVIARLARDDRPRNLEIEMNNLVLEYENREILKESIYDLYNKYPLKYNYDEEIILTSNEDMSIEVSGDNSRNIDEVQSFIPLSEVDNFSIIGVGFNDHYDRKVEKGQIKKELLYLRTKFIDSNEGGDDEASINRLYNEKTGEEVRAIQGSTIPEIHSRMNEDGLCTTISENYYELTNTEKLKHIKPVVSYVRRTVSNNGKRTLRINMKKKTICI